MGEGHTPPSIVYEATEQHVIPLVAQLKAIIADVEKRSEPSWWVVDKDATPEQKIAGPFTTDLDAGRAREIIERHSNRTYWIVKQTKDKE